MHKSLLKIGIAAVFVLLLVCCGAAAGAEHDNTHNGITWTTWSATNALPTETGNHNIYLTDNVTLTSTWSVPAGTTNLCLNGHVIKMTGTTGSVIQVLAGATLNLYDCGTSERWFKYVSEGNAWTEYVTTQPSGNNIKLYDSLDNFNRTEADAHLATSGNIVYIKVTGGVITGGSVTGGNGGGVYVSSGGGMFTMTGGNIVGNSAKYSGDGGDGGGVYVNGGTFEMDGGSIAGNTATRNGGGVYVNTGACTFEMSGTASITGNSASGNGGGVYTSGSSTDYKFTMNGGNITGNHASGSSGGGGVYTAGTFTMNKGNIDGNKARSGGGVSVMIETGGSECKFTMFDGSITGNRATTNNGGGVHVEKGTFEMIGGTISKNIAKTNGGGVWNKGTFTMSNNACITGNTAGLNGGGVYGSNTFTMSGGSIADNIATTSGGGVFYGGEFTMSNNACITGNKVIGDSSKGGGVYVAGVMFTMKGGTIGGSGDDRNTAKDGGGVYVAGGTFTMSSTASITGNEATGSNGGGGVYVSNGEFTMKDDAKITGNKATQNGGGVLSSKTFNMQGGTIGGTGNDRNTATNGGGVYIDAGTFTMSSTASTASTASITGNTAELNGGGVYNNAVFKVSGSPKISGNKKTGDAPNNVYLPTGKTITIAGVLNSGANIWVNPTDGAEPGTSFASGWSVPPQTLLPSSIFTADNGNSVAVRISNEVVFKDTNYAVCGSGSVEPSYYESLNGAYSAASAGQTIIVLRDVPETAQTEMTGDKSVTLDLNGKSITAGNAFADGLIKWGSTGKLTITDSETDGKLNGDSKTRLLYVNKGTVKMTSGKITGGNAEYGGGVYVTSGGTFTMCGGNIAGNTATNYGGGVYVDVGTFTMSDSAHITGNSATNGGGVYLNSCSFTMKGGIIGGTGDEGNSATYGGGVYVCYDTFTMEGGSITGNKATDGGGVYVTQWGDPDIDTYGGTLNMSNGRIAENTATGNGGGVYVVNHGVFKVSGTPDISGNKKNTDVNNVYLTSGKKITIAGSGLTNNAKIGVTTQTLPAAGTPVDVTEKTSLLYSISSFTSDNPSYRVKDTTEGENRVVKLFVCHTVSFNANGHGIDPESQTVTEGEKVTKPTDPTADGYTFGGWFTDENCTAEYDFDKPVTADLTLYALWKANTQPSSSSRSYGASIWLPATAEPTPVPTADPTQTIPTVTPTKPQPTPASPVPVAGILAGLGAAAVFFGLRRR